MDKSEKDEIEGMIDFGESKDTEKTIKIPEIKNEPIRQDTVSDTTEEAADSDNSVYDSPAEDDEAEEAAEVSPGADDDVSDTDGDDNTAPETDEITEDDDFGSAADYGYGEAEYVFEEEEEKKPVSKKFKIIRHAGIAALILAIIAAFVFIDSGFIGTYKTNFYHNFCRIFKITEKTDTETETSTETNDAGQAKLAETKTVKEERENKNADKNEEKKENKKEKHKTIHYTAEKESMIIPCENAETAEFEKYADGIVCSTSNSLKYINLKGETEWECTTSVIDPILSVAGKYIFLAQNGGTKICLYEGKKLLYDTDTQSNILTADVSANGDAALVTDREMYNGTIEAYNKKGDCVYLWSSGDLNVTDAAISPVSRDIAAAMINTNDTVSSAVRIFDIEKEGAKHETKFENTLLFDVEYFGNTVNVFGDNSMVGINGRGKTVYNITFENTPVAHYAYDGSGNKIVCAEINNIPTLMTFNQNGKQKLSAAVDEIPSFLAITGNKAMYNSDRSMFLGKVGASRLVKYTAGMDIKDLIMINKSTFFLIYSNSIQLVKI